MNYVSVYGIKTLSIRAVRSNFVCPGVSGSGYMRYKGYVDMYDFGGPVGGLCPRSACVTVSSSIAGAVGDASNNVF